jgi:aryl-alcohol dehydrogenase-like predicted oxidoreductase
MEYRTLGRTGIKVSPLALGCLMFGGKTDQAETTRIIGRALDAGVNLLDTANTYHAGRSEEFVGAALRALGARDRVLVCTKVGGEVGPGGPDRSGGSRRHLIAQCEASLRRLGTDHLDLYLLHRPDPATPIAETLGAFDHLVRAGKVRHVGTSNFGAWEVVEALWCARENRLPRVACEQPPYNLLDRRIERELIPACRTFGVAVMAWSPLAGGLLSGKYRAGEAVPPGTRFAERATNPIAASRWTEATLARVERLRAVAAALGRDPMPLSLAWVMQQPGVCSAIVGPRTLGQFEENLEALALRFSAEELRLIDAAAPPGSHTSPYYEGGFQPHVRG